MDTALPQKFPFILDRNLAKANCTENQVCTSCDIVVLGIVIYSTCIVAYLHLAMSYFLCIGCFESLFVRYYMYDKK